MSELERAAIDLVVAEGHCKAVQHYGVSKAASDEAMRGVVAAFDRLKQIANQPAPFRVASSSQMLQRAVRAQGQCIEELSLMLAAVAKTLPDSEAAPLIEQVGAVLERARLATEEAAEAVA